MSLPCEFGVSVTSEDCRSGICGRRFTGTEVRLQSLKDLRPVIKNHLEGTEIVQNF